MGWRGWILLVGVGVLAAAAGAALPRPTYRLAVAWGEPPRDRCEPCGLEFPGGLLGWLRLDSRCPGCRARLGPRAWVFAAIAMPAALGLAWRFGPTATLVPYLVLVPLGCLLAAIDITCRRLPELLVLPAIGVSLLAFAGLTLLGEGGWGSWLRALLGGLAFGGAYLLLALLPGGQLGGGDVTLGALLGVYLGWLGWPFVIIGALSPFLVNAPVAIGLLIARRVGRRSDLPFGPAMLAGAYLAVVGTAALGALLAG